MTNSREISVDLDCGITIAREICAAYTSGRGIFRDTSDLLEHQIPGGVRPLSREHANFLFFLISQDHSTKSARLYARAKAVYRETPEVFEPRSVIKRYRDGADSHLVKDVAGRLGTRYPNETARQWYANSEALNREYAGDARRIFYESCDSPEALIRIRRFRGFGPKTSALLFRTFYGCGFFRLPKHEEIPIPVDIHDTRIAVSTGILRIRPSPGPLSSTNYMAYSKAAQEAWVAICRRADLDWLILDRALWLLGSRGCRASGFQECCLIRDCSQKVLDLMEA